MNKILKNFQIIIGFFFANIASSDIDLHKQPICKLDGFNSLSDEKWSGKFVFVERKGLMAIFPELIAAKQTDKSNYLMGTTMYGKQIALPLTYFDLESAIAVEAEYGEEGDLGKFALVVAPGQNNALNMNVLFD